MANASKVATGNGIPSTSNGNNPALASTDAERWDVVGAHCSANERRADEAERETDKLKKVEYMEQHIGEEYEGVISGVTGWGLYVELPNTVEGLVHISTIPGDYYHYNEAACEMVGEATGRCFKLGMPVRIEVEDCDRFMRTINFRLVDK